MRVALDARAAARRAVRLRSVVPWLHDETARRMAQRLGDIEATVERWADVSTDRGGTVGDAAVTERWPQARRVAPENAAREGGVQLIRSNMRLHYEAQPQQLLTAWRKALSPGGFILFSCCGEKTLQNLRKIYLEHGWGPPAHDFYSLHEIGNLAVAAGFDQPVVDTEIIRLGFSSPERLLTELRELGGNCAVGRFPGLRGRKWRRRLLDALENLRDETGQYISDFEILYGYARAPAPTSEVEVTLEALQRTLPKRSHA